MTDRPPPEDQPPATVIGRRDFDNPIYTSVMNEHEEAFRLVLSILNNRENELRLIDASMHGDPAVQGVSDILRNERLLLDILTNNEIEGSRQTVADKFRKTLGHVVKEKMEGLGWRPRQPKRQKLVQQLCGKFTIFEPIR